MAADHSPPSSPAGILHSRAAASTGEDPQIALGADFTAAALVPGRYATAIQRTLQGIHDAQWLVEDSTASFVLTLAGDGMATACRGWRYNFTNDGPVIHTAERFREQQGYRGQYTLASGVVEVELHTDDSVCPAKREPALVLARSATVKLRCVLATSHGQMGLKAPVLLCQWVGVTTGEREAHLVAGLAPDGWMVLGSGNGLRMNVIGQPAGSREGEPTKIIAEPVSMLLACDAWEKAF